MKTLIQRKEWIHDAYAQWLNFSSKTGFKENILLENNLV